ncbi:MAG: hypothetical protein QF752_14335, partial [Planctomycetota bacterium]|nr:hypothetical protein [Planctomycetota bacterium]
SPPSETQHIQPPLALGWIDPHENHNPRGAIGIDSRADRSLALLPDSMSFLLLTTGARNSHRYRETRRLLDAPLLIDPSRRALISLFPSEANSDEWKESFLSTLAPKETLRPDSLPNFLAEPDAIRTDRHDRQVLWPLIDSFLAHAFGAPGEQSFLEDAAPRLNKSQTTDGQPSGHPSVVWPDGHHK